MNPALSPEVPVTFLQRRGGPARWLLPGIGVAMISVSVCWLPSVSPTTDVHPAARWPHIEFSPPLKLELPGLRMGTETKFAAVVKNPSDEALRVHQVSASCSCTDVRLDVTEIPAGGQAQLTGTLRSRPGEKKSGSTVTIGVVGMKSGRRTNAKYPVSAEMIPTISFTTEFYDAEPIAGSDEYDAGSLVVKNTSDREVSLEVLPSNFESKSVRVIPSQATLSPGETRSLSIEVDRMPERHGTLNLSVDAGRGDAHDAPAGVDGRQCPSQSHDTRIRTCPRDGIAGGVLVPCTRLDQRQVSLSEFRGSEKAARCASQSQTDSYERSRVDTRL